MVVVVALFAYGGYWLDGRLGTLPLFVVVGSLLGAVGGFIHFLARVAPEHRVEYAALVYGVVRTRPEAAAVDDHHFSFGIFAGVGFGTDVVPLTLKEGDPGNPYATIGEGASHTGPGDTVYVRGGEYYNSSYGDGVPDNWNNGVRILNLIFTVCAIPKMP